CYGEDGALICGYADFVIHTHDDLCYDEYGNLICPLPEIKMHEHDAGCYQERLRLTCGQEETGHVHDKSCYTRYRGELACGLEETEGHTHDADCYQTIRELACGLEESAEHAHDDSCYRERTELICSLPETEGHTHTDDCYDWISELTCGLEEVEGHIHDESCYTAETVLTCQRQEAVPHTHDAGCFDENGALICGRTETLSHRHTEDCLLVSADAPEETRVLICGMQEHAHTDACYPPEIDSGESEDWEAVMKELGLTGEYRQDVLTVAESQLGVQESEIDVITTAGGEIKGYTRYGNWYGDPYGDWCAMFASFCLHYAQVPEKAFPQEASCEKWIADLQKERFDLYREALPDDDSAPYIPSPGDLVFFSTRSDGYADHVGLVAEWMPGTGDEPDAIRVIEGNSNDRVQYVTYELPDDRILGYGELPEQTFYCGMTGHVHGDDCRNFWGQLDCDLEEHVHTEACTLAPGEQPPTVQTFTGEDFTVRVEYGADAELPEGVTLAVEEIPADSAEYQLYFSQSIEAMEADQSAETVVFARFFDIRFEQNGQTLEPAAPVSVTITYDTVADADLPANCRSIHFGSEGTELLPAETEELDAGEFSFTHTQDSFSVVGNLMTVDYSVSNSTDVGPSRLPVDYFVCVDGEWVCAGSTKTGWYGDYTATGWTDYNRDYITVEQAESVLGIYGFDSSNENPARRIAYQMKYGDTKIYSDTNTVEIGGNRVIPLSRNASHAGFNVYFLPNNVNSFVS
ncbi:MAG: hypothetical protein ACI4PD_05160, partial [Butyricicoccus sp.]